MLSMKQKGEVLDIKEGGMSPKAVGKLFGINESTVRGIRAKKDNIRASTFICFTYNVR